MDTKVDIKEELKNRDVPDRYLDCSFENFKGNDLLIKKIKDYLKNKLIYYPERSLFLYGPVGSGKTHLAVAILREIIIDISVKESRENPYSRFYSTSKVLLEIRDTFNRRVPGEPTERDIIDRIIKKDFIILDDYGTQKISDFTRESIYLIIEGRDAAIRPTIITSNLSPKQIAEHIDPRIASRLQNGAIIKIDMPDYRVKGDR